MKTTFKPAVPQHAEDRRGGSGADAADFAERVRLNQQKLQAQLQPHYDFIVCGSGSSGSVVARRLAENADVSVLLLEAGGTDEIPSVMDAGQWPLILETDRQWNFRAQSNPRLNGRAMPLNMGRVLGGGSSVNAMIWARGHKNDWDFFASEGGDNAWDYDSVLAIYRRIEDWRGVPDQQYLLGHSEDEELRLRRQAEELRCESARLFDRIGLGAGSRAIDLGCGPQGVLDVLSERVGPTGCVVGIDKRWSYSARGLNTPDHRTAQCRFSRIEVPKRAEIRSVSEREFQFRIGPRS